MPRLAPPAVLNGEGRTQLSRIANTGSMIEKNNLYMTIFLHDRVEIPACHALHPMIQLNAAQAAPCLQLPLPAHRLRTGLTRPRTVGFTLLANFFQQGFVCRQLLCAGLDHTQA